MPPKSPAIQDSKDGVRKGAAAHLDASALLDVLAPPPGFVLDRALCSAYSAHSTVLVAMLMAMSGYGTFEGRGGSAQAFAKAMRRFRGHVHFLVQHGHWTGPRKHLPMLHMLDRFVIQVHHDERQRSWHPKVCVLRFAPAGGAGAARWRLWIGSRNFTRDRSWDLALALEGEEAGKGSSVAGVELLVSRLAREAGQDAAWRGPLKELVTVRWNPAAGLNVDALALDSLADSRQLPLLPADTKRAILVAPFLDSNTLAHLKSSVQGKTGPRAPKLTLVSTEMALAELKGKYGALTGYQLMTLPPASQEQLQDEEVDEESTDVECEAQGLHAKFLWIETPGQTNLVLGSTNLTERGWLRNTEARAVLSMNHPGSDAVRLLRTGIDAFLDVCTEVTTESLPDIDLTEQASEQAFSQMCNALASDLSLSQTLTGDGEVIVTATKAPELHHGALLRISRPGDVWVDWPPGQTMRNLPSSTPHDNGNSLQVELQWERFTSRWLHHAPFDETLDTDERDKSLLCSTLGLEGLLALLNDMLGAGGGTGGSRKRWDDSSPPSGTPVTLLGIEAVLAAWVRSPRSLRDAADVVSLAKGVEPRTVREHAAYRQLNAFLTSWQAIETELLKK